MQSPRNLLSQLRQSVNEIPLKLYVLFRRRKLKDDALTRISSCGGRIYVSHPTEVNWIPIVCGLNNCQLFDAKVNVSVSLPEISEKEWSELQPFLLSLPNLHVCNSLNPKDFVTPN